MAFAVQVLVCGLICLGVTSFAEQTAAESVSSVPEFNPYTDICLDSFCSPGFKCYRHLPGWEYACACEPLANDCYDPVKDCSTKFCVQWGATQFKPDCILGNNYICSPGTRITSTSSPPTTLAPTNGLLMTECPPGYCPTGFKCKNIKSNVYMCYCDAKQNPQCSVKDCETVCSKPGYSATSCVTNFPFAICTGLRTHFHATCPDSYCSDGLRCERYIPNFSYNCVCKAGGAEGCFKDCRDRHCAEGYHRVCTDFTDQTKSNYHCMADTPGTSASRVPAKESKQSVEVKVENKESKSGNERLVKSS